MNSVQVQINGVWKPVVSVSPPGTAQDFAKGAEHWEYDANGNRTKYTNNGRTETWEYFSDSNIQSKYNGSVRNRYDAQGNITSLLWVYNFTNDDLGRVKELDYPAPLDISLTINYQNHRVAKQVTDRISNNTRYQSFIFDHTGRLVGEKYYAKIFEGVTNRKHYIYFAGEIVGYVLNNELYFVHNDHLGRPEVITDSGKNVAWQAKYDIFGSRSLLTSNQSLDFQIGLPGQYWEMYAGSWYNWNRYYDSSTGRYIQSDPIGLNGGINTYAYVQGNPLRYVDPFGLRGMNSGYPYDGNAPLPDVGVTGCVGVVCASSDFGGDSTEVSIGLPELGGNIYICVPQPQAQQEAESECSKPEMVQTIRGSRRASGSSAGSPDVTFSANLGKFVGFSTGEGKTCIKIGVGLSSPFSVSKSNSTL